MKQIQLLLVCLTISSFGHCMKKQEPKRNNKSLDQEWKFKIPIVRNALVHDLTEKNILIDDSIEKSVFIVAPQGLSKGKAATYFRKNEKQMKDKVTNFMNLCEALLYNMDDEEAIASGKEQEFQCTHLYRLLTDSDSLFEFKLEENSIFLRRDIRGVSLQGPQGWYFIEILEITLDESLPTKGKCSELMVQCHHDRAGVHDKVFVSELERFYEESGRLPIHVKLRDEPMTLADLEKAGTIRKLQAREYRLIAMACMFVCKHPKYKHLFPKK